MVCSELGQAAQRLADQPKLLRTDTAGFATAFPGARPFLVISKKMRSAHSAASWATRMRPSNIRKMLLSVAVFRGLVQAAPGPPASRPLHPTPRGTSEPWPAARIYPHRTALGGLHKGPRGIDCPCAAQLGSELRASNCNSSVCATQRRPNASEPAPRAVEGSV